jgi:hypothetical protein
VSAGWWCERSICEGWSSPPWPRPPLWGTSTTRRQTVWPMIQANAIEAMPLVTRTPMAWGIDRQDLRNSGSRGQVCPVTGPNRNDAAPRHNISTQARGVGGLSRRHCGRSAGLDGWVWRAKGEVSRESAARCGVFRIVTGGMRERGRGVPMALSRTVHAQSEESSGRDESACGYVATGGTSDHRGAADGGGLPTWNRLVLSHGGHRSGE